MVVSSPWSRVTKTLCNWRSSWRGCRLKSQVTWSACAVQIRVVSPLASQPPGKKRQRGSCFNSVWTELLGFLLFSPAIQDTDNITNYLSTLKILRTTSPRSSIFLYRFVKKSLKENASPKWSPKCARTTTATARPPSTGWSTWRCSPPTPTLPW